MTWPPRQPQRSELAEDEVVFWDAIVGRGRLRSKERLELLAQISELAEGPEKALYTGEINSWDGKHRPDSIYLDPEKRAVPYGQLLHSPEIAFHIASLGAHIRLRADHRDTYSHADREWVNQVFYVDLGISYCQRTHVADALAVGVRLEAIEALHEGREWDLSPDERLLTEFIRRVERRTMNLETWAAMETRLGESGAVDYAMEICIYWLIATLTRAFNFYPEYSRQQVDKYVQSFKDGAPVPDYRVNQPDSWLDEWSAKRYLRDKHVGGQVTTRTV